MPHAFAGRRGHPGDIADHGFADMGLDKFGRLFLGRAADLADHDHARRGRVGLKQPETVNEAQAMDRVSADAHTGALAEAVLRGLQYGLVSERARARDDADFAGLMDRARHDPDLACAGRDHTRTVRADQAALGKAFQTGPGLEHIQHRDPLGDADDDFDAGLGRLDDRLGRGVGRGHDHAGVRARGRDRVRDAVEHGAPQMRLTALAGRDPAHDLGLVGDGLFGMKGALPAREALHDDLCVLIH